MSENWLPIPGHEGLYEVSDLGRIRSVAHQGPTRWVPQRILRQSIGTHGYPKVSLQKDLQAKSHTVHSLVASAFLGPRPEGMEVRHLDGNCLNPVAANLRYGTRSENRYDQVRHGTHPFASKKSCPRGHAYTPENTYVRGSRRTCRTCSRERARITQPLRRKRNRMASSPSGDAA